MAKIHKDSLLRARKNLRVEGVITYGGLASKHFEGLLPAGEILSWNTNPPIRCAAYGWCRRGMPN